MTDAEWELVRERAIEAENALAELRGVGAVPEDGIRLHAAHLLAKMRLESALRSLG